MTRRLALALLLLGGCHTGFKETDADATIPHDGPRPEGSTSDSEVVPPECPAKVKSEDVDSVHEPGAYSSIVVDGKGDVHISHMAQGPTPGPMGGDWFDARYTVRRAGLWSSEDIYTPGVVGAYSALGLGPGGELHVVFYSYSSRDLVHSWRDSQGWKPAQVMSTSYNDGWGTDLAVDSSGTVHVVTFKGAEGTIDGEWLYLRRVGSKWQSPVVLESPAGGGGPSSGIAVDSTGTVHVSFSNHLGQLKYRSGKDGSFKTAVILDTGLGELCRSDLALDGQGQVHISYYDSVPKTLRYIGQTGGIFGQAVTLDSAGQVGANNAIAAGDDDVWIAYHDADNRDLKLIRRAKGSWGQAVPVDTAGEVGLHVSAALGPGGELHISHYNMTSKSLRHTRVCP